MIVRLSRFVAPALVSLIALASLGDSAAQDKKAPAPEPAAMVTIEVYQDKGDEFRFRIKNGTMLLAISGKGYDKKADCLKVLDTIKAGIGKAKIVEIPKDKK